MIKVILERCAGIDVGKRFVVVCLLTGAASECPQMEKRQYDATVVELEKLRAWLVAEGCTHVVVLANPMHVKNLGGHKTDRPKIASGWHICYSTV